MERPWLKHVVEGNPTEIDIPEISLPQLFDDSVLKYENHTAITFYGKTYSYKQLEGLIQNVAKSLNNIGIHKGDRVALMLPNCPQYVISYYAVLTLGATVVQVNPMYKSPELLHVLKDSEAKIIIGLDSFVPIIKEVENDTSLLTIINVSFEGDCKFDDLLKDKGLSVPEVQIIPREDIAVLQYTGGTTGRSKGSMLTHYNLVANTCQSYATATVK